MIYVTKNRDGDAMFESEADSFIQHIEALVASRKSLAHADLRWADLRGVDIRWADLRGADLRVANIRGVVTVVQGLDWGVYVTKRHIRIGCESHPLHVWEAFSDEEISAMHKKAPQFWREYKDFLVKECKKLG